MTSSPRLAHFATELVLDVGADDVLEIRFRLEAERQRALSVSALGPSPDDPDHQFVGHALDARDGGRSCDAAEGRDLLADGAADAGHREVDPVAELLARQRRGMQQETYRGPRAGMGMPHSVRHRQHRLCILYTSDAADERS